MEYCDSVIAGIDTHKNSHVLCLLDKMGRKIGSWSFSATSKGNLELAKTIGDPHRCLIVGIEGSASFGASLCRYLIGCGYPVVEVLRPKRDKRRKGLGKNDDIDAERAARNAIAGHDISTPKSTNGWVEQIRALMIARDIEVQTSTKIMNATKSLLITATDEIRERFIHLSGSRLMQGIFRSRSIDTTYADALKSLAKTWLELEKRISKLENQIKRILLDCAPALLEISGCGPINAADLAIAAGDNPKRLKSEASFASLCGVAPLDASSGEFIRHRLNRGGNRSANRALHMIVINRMSHDEKTKEYVIRRTTQGKTKREAIRCLKRYVAREVYKALICPLTTKHPKGSDLSSRRIALGLSQKSIAKQLGVASTRISEIEREIRQHHQSRDMYEQFLSELEKKQTFDNLCERNHSIVLSSSDKAFLNVGVLQAKKVEDQRV